MEMTAILERQRAAFMAELPVSIAARKDRLRRAVAMMVEHADAFAEALSSDFGHRSREQSLMTDVVASVRTLKHAIKHVLGHIFELDIKIWFGACSQCLPEPRARSKVWCLDGALVQGLIPIQ